MEGGQFHQREHWLSLAPRLHIGERSLFENVAHLELSPDLARAFKDDGKRPFAAFAVNGRNIDIRCQMDAIAHGHHNVRHQFGLLKRPGRGR